MFSLIKREKIEDKYELTKSVQLVDVKGYLQKEYERATERETLIKELEDEIEEYKKMKLKYDAMLVVQEQTQKRIERQDEIIKGFREKIKIKDDEIKVAISRQFDIKTNAEKKLKEKDALIKDLKKQLKEATKPKSEPKSKKKNVR